MTKFSEMVPFPANTPEWFKAVDELHNKLLLEAVANAVNIEHAYWTNIIDDIQEAIILSGHDCGPRFFKFKRNS